VAADHPPGSAATEDILVNGVHRGPSDHVAIVAHWLAARLVRDYVAKNLGVADDLARVRLAPSPRGSVGGYVRPSHSSGAGTGWNKWP
jgi:hypothetical protein